MNREEEQQKRMRGDANVELLACPTWEHVHTGSIEIIFFNLKPSTLSLSLSLSLSCPNILRSQTRTERVREVELLELFFKCD